jgi:pilus assembly protein Flp/PilA
MSCRGCRTFFRGATTGYRCRGGNPFNFDPFADPDISDPGSRNLRFWRSGSPWNYQAVYQREEVQLKYLLKFWSDESGATAIEYGLIAAGIALAIIATVNLLGGTLNTNFTSINSSLK